MQVEEINAEGLSREIKITVTKSSLNEKLDGRLDELKDQVEIKGFRKGKVPAAHLKKIYGTQVMSEIVQQLVNEQSQQALTDRDERPALQPEIKLDGEVEQVMQGEADLIFAMIYDIIPPINLTDFSKLSLNRKVVEIADAEVDESLARLAQSRKQFEPRGKTAKAQNGDSVKIDFLGRIDGEAFDGGASEGFDLELGSGQFIPGFEEQLIGTKAGDKLDVEVPFPEDYGNADLAGKQAVFEVTVHEVSEAKEAEIDEAFATSLGMESLDKLKEAIREQIGTDYNNMTREQIKRDLLEILNDKHDFELPEKMIDLEFNQIWHQFEHELENQGQKLDELDESEEDLRSEYRGIAERRVRTGLVLAEVGQKNEIEVTQEELNQGLMQRVQQFPGQEQQVFNYFRENPDAMAQIRAPIFENKVIDFIVEQAKVSEETVSIDDLMAANSDAQEDKPAKKTAKKTAKKAAKKPAAKKPAAKKPAAKKPAAKKPATKKPAAKKPAAKKPATKKPAAKKPAK